MPARQRFTALAATAMVITLLVPLSAVAQTVRSAETPRVEIWGGWAAAPPASGGALAADYEPVLRLGGTNLDSRATQTMVVDQGAGYGVDVGLNVFFSRFVGLQAVFSSVSSDVAGTKGDTYSYLRYSSRQPPDYQPREYVHEQRSPWGPAAGTLKHRSIGIGGVLRWTAARSRVGGTVAGGVHVERYAGEIASLAYTQFIMGGHSTLFSVQHGVVMAPAEGHSLWGPYIGGDIHVRVARRVALFGGVRVAVGSRSVLPTTAVRLVDPNENPWAPEKSDVRTHLDGQPLELPGTHWHTTIGLKVFVK